VRLESDARQTLNDESALDAERQASNPATATSRERAPIHGGIGTRSRDQRPSNRVPRSRHSSRGRRSSGPAERGRARVTARLATLEHDYRTCIDTCRAQDEDSRQLSRWTTL